MSCVTSFARHSRRRSRRCCKRRNPTAGGRARAPRQLPGCVSRALRPPELHAMFHTSKQGSHPPHLSSVSSSTVYSTPSNVYFLPADRLDASILMSE